MNIAWKLPLGLGLLSCIAVPASAADPSSQWGTGDWGGLRSELLEQGVDVIVGYVGEGATNVHGGYNHDRTARYTAQWALGTHLDLQKLLGWNDAEFQLLVTERNGNNLSNERVSDPRAPQLSSVQEVWGRGQTWRLTQMWYRQKFFDSALDLKLGRLGVNEDFASFPCDFQSLSFCSAPIGNVAGDVWYSGPVSQWGARVRYNLNEQWAVQVGAYEQNPSYLSTGNGFKLSGSGTKGALVPVEVIWKPTVGQQALPGEYRLGYYHSSAAANDVYEDINGAPQALTGQAPKSRSSKHGAWIMGQQQFTAHHGDASRGLSVFASLTVHDKATSSIESFQNIGAVYKGPFDARPKDDIGLGVARLKVNDDVTKRQRLINDSTGITDYDDPLYVPVQHSEYNIELNYGVHVTDWLTVRPNVQYVRNPGGVYEVDNAWVAGLKLQASF
ncbi:porin [Pseudomonas marginalis]|jgi:porin|uniref:carbohydrate porin n=1 Tax=Pseudomonas marginalis TaxID=298 RepID=UPI0020A1F58D|nr:carbohydrate porin [Pseudomonas marginalis]MCP1507642.1 porin [Pseudomonas marginalis]MCP1525146.1 porin [Pseudomonas marginalis]MDQ0500259.1 porin [Pseudomonas marginalis]